jgi:hypothetical protein
MFREPPVGRGGTRLAVIGLATLVLSTLLTGCAGFLVFADEEDIVGCWSHDQDESRDVPTGAGRIEFEADGTFTWSDSDNLGSVLRVPYLEGRVERYTGTWELNSEGPLPTPFRDLDVDVWLEGVTENGNDLGLQFSVHSPSRLRFWTNLDDLAWVTFAKSDTCN